jgi:hypothetical protein
VGGSGNYTYTWSNGGNASSITGLTAGNYAVTIGDGSGCSVTATQTVAQPSALNAGLTTTNVLCNGAANGTAALNASGGTAGYSYAWSNNTTLSTVADLAPGSYSVTVTDALNCSTSASFNITQPTQVNASAVTVQPSCAGSANGTATGTASGGNPPYVYHWSTGSNVAQSGSLVAGNYVLTVLDSKGCSATASVNITDPATLQVSGSSIAATNGGFNGTASVNVTGGTAPYNYLWSNGSVTSSASNVPAGNYIVTVTDANGCSTAASVDVANVTGISELNTGIYFSAYPNPATTDVTVVMANVATETMLSIKDVLGQTVLTQSITTAKTAINASALMNGIYIFEIKQGNNRAMKQLLINK